MNAISISVKAFHTTVVYIFSEICQYIAARYINVFKVARCSVYPSLVYDVKTLLNDISAYMKYLYAV